MELPSLLAPFLDAPLSGAQLAQLQAYLDLLLQWNARINLTGVRDADNIVTRHFGESLFAARHLLPAAHLIDVGSGAGFPGLPMKIYFPRLRLTLIEAQNKKATFLRELVRTLDLHDVNVFADRAENFSQTADLVATRAVEKFENSLPAAARLVAPAGRLALLVGAAQVDAARRLLPAFEWLATLAVPQSAQRVLLVGRAPTE